MIVEEEEGIEIFCPFCQKPVLIPAGYNRPTYLCPRCKRAIPLSEEVLEQLRHTVPSEN